MKLDEKIGYLQDHHFGKWLKTRQATAEIVSNQYPTFCICGRLCTGLHESSCRKFNARVNSETVKKLAHLIKEVKSNV